MKVLVTGSAGFVGQAFMKYYADRPGTTVVGLDVKQGNRYDCRDFFETSDLKFNTVIHCAAVVGGRATIDGEPLRLAVEDLSIDAAMFRWAMRTKPERIVYFSSSAAYPPEHQVTPGVRLNEQSYTPGRCDQTYGWVKQTGEMLAAEANKLGLFVHVFRPFSGYGQEQSLDYPFPSFVMRAALKQDPFEIWGSPESARDWIHIDDIVGAVQAAITYRVPGPVNLCSGEATTFGDLAEMCMNAAGYYADIVSKKDAPQGVHWRVGDPTKMRGFYTPKVSLEEGIERALRHYLA